MTTAQGDPEGGMDNSIGQDVPEGANYAAHNTHSTSMPLHFVARDLDIPTVIRLLASGANPNSSDAFGQTALHWSIDSEIEDADCVGFLDCTTTHILLAFGADPRIPDEKGATPEDWAVRRNHYSAVMLIRRYLRLRQQQSDTAC